MPGVTPEGHTCLLWRFPELSEKMLPCAQIRTCRLQMTTLFAFGERVSHPETQETWVCVDQGLLPGAQVDQGVSRGLLSLALAEAAMF